MQSTSNGVRRETAQNALGGTGRQPGSGPPDPLRKEQGRRAWDTSVEPSGESTRTRNGVVPDHGKKRAGDGERRRRRPERTGRGGLSRGLVDGRVTPAGSEYSAAGQGRGSRVSGGRNHPLSRSGFLRLRREASGLARRRDGPVCVGPKGPKADAPRETLLSLRSKVGGAIRRPSHTGRMTDPTLKGAPCIIEKLWCGL